MIGTLPVTSKHAGVPISIISKWAGHYDSAFTQKTYVHASEEDLQRGQAATRQDSQDRLGL